MQERTDGDFDVDPGEQITITAQRTQPPCVVTFASAKGAICTPPVSPDQTTIQRTCTTPTTSGVVWIQSITFGFPTAGANAPVNDSYTVTVQGQTGPSVEDAIHPPPDPRDRTYVFHVV